jgi:hypothetical protein
VGALAATPQVRHLVSPAPAAAAGHQSAAGIDDTGQAVSAAIGQPSSARQETYFAQRAKTASGHAPAAPAKKKRVTHVTASAKAAPAVSASPQPAVSSAPAAAAGPASGAQGTPNCTGSGGMLPENYAAIVDFLVSRGYTDNAAAGIAGNIYQESGGNPESGGYGAGGLIGWTPLPAGYITGNSSADLATQLSGILTFNDALSAGLPALNAAASPAAAADIYVTDFEHASLPAAGTREASANAVAAACGI